LYPDDYPLSAIGIYPSQSILEILEHQIPNFRV